MRVGHRGGLAIDRLIDWRGAAAFVAPQAVDLHGSFPIIPVLAKDAYAASLRSQNSVSNLTKTNAYDVVTMHQKRMELLAKKRKLRMQELEAQAKLDEVQAELRNNDSQIAMMSVK